MEVYRSETKEIIRRFLIHQLSFPNCIATLDAALADLISRLPPEGPAAVRKVMLANNEIVMAEMERRGPPRRRGHPPAEGR
jgi:hypothetical protein